MNIDRWGLTLLARALKLPPDASLPDDPLDLLNEDERFSLKLEMATRPLEEDQSPPKCDCSRDKYS